jgi:pyrroline-5-carboxylate reductase
MKTKSIGFLGGGRITRILLQGFNNKYIEFPSIKVCDTNPNILNDLKNDFPMIEKTDSIDGLSGQEIIFIALHPPVIGENAIRLKGLIKENTLLISLAPKFSIEKLSELTATKRIVRMIPNATSYINKGYNPLCFSGDIDNKEKEQILDMLKPLGNNFETEEKKLEAYAICSAMLPTYFWFQWKEMEKIGKEIGLTETESTDTIKESLKASMQLMFDSNIDYEKVVDLIPVKPIGEKEPEIKEILNNYLIALFNKIKP